MTMLGLTRDGVREHFYDSEKDDYFYKDTGERVPDYLRVGFYTTVFRQSSRRRIEDETPEQRKERDEKWAQTREYLRNKYKRS
jgi:hypothetical protein